jgi:hypothetical protein
MRKKLYLSLLILFLLFFKHGILSANNVRYVSPKPGSVNNMEKTNIIIGFADKLNTDAVNLKQITVTGTLSGVHTGKIIFVEKNTKIIFTSDNPFALGEKVTVSGIKNASDFSFYIRNVIPVLPDNFYRDVSFTNEVKNVPYHRDFLIRPDSLPAFTIYNSGTTADGYLFIANFGGTLYNSILMMLNNNGSPNFARTLGYRAYDFKKQNDNLLTYYYEKGNKFFGLNASYNIVDSFYTGNGYTTDFHETVVTADGSAWLMSYDAEYVDMSLIVPGGKTNALVTGLIVQKINAQKNVVFQWKSWDYFQITDATHEVLTAYNIDYVHGNAIEIDNDSNILISSRHLDEITKVNSETGDIIWRMGGKNNQFTFLNDTLKFSHQHCVRRLPNGHIILFDNGNYHPTPFSRAVEYSVDEIAKTVELKWQYRHSPDIYASAMGSVQRLSNGNTLIGWGSASTTLTEVDSAGTIKYQLSLPSGQMSYRAFRFEWGNVTGVSGDDEITSDNFRLFQNYPNPFNPSTTISFDIIKGGYTTLVVYDILGKEITTLVNGNLNAGSYKVKLNGTGFPSGVYFYKIISGSYTDIKKMMLIK